MGKKNYQPEPVSSPQTVLLCQAMTISLYVCEEELPESQILLWSLEQQVGRGQSPTSIRSPGLGREFQNQSLQYLNSQLP
jgi:hypothetical protein